MTYNRKSIDIIARALCRQKETLAVAESVTSGHLQAAMSLAHGATQFFQGGITTYNLTEKVKLLQVDPMHAVECNCVSPKVADEMAKNVLRLFNADWSISITGYAAKVPEAGINDLYCYFSIATKDGIVLSEKITSQEMDPLEVQIHYTNTILQKLCEVLSSSLKKVS